jgi:hypothetical protein
MSHALLVIVFAIAAGLTLSGITANLYRLALRQPQNIPAAGVHLAVMIFAGPSVLIENSTASLRKHDCSRQAYAFAVILAAYWCFMLGLVVLSVGEALV